MGVGAGLPCGVAWQTHRRTACPRHPSQLVMNVPYTALHFAVYESAKKFLTGSGGTAPAAAEAGAGAGSLLTSAAAQGAAAGASSSSEEVEGEEEEGLLVQLVAGGTAGGLAGAATTPLDVVKTRLQLEGLSSSTRYNTTAVVRVWGVGWGQADCLEAGAGPGQLLLYLGRQHGAHAQPTLPSPPAAARPAADSGR